MKLVTYTPSVPKTAGGSARVDAPDAKALYNIGNMQAQGLGGFMRGVNAALGVMQKQAEEKEMTKVTAAQTEYAKRVSDMLYNEENGLMNRQLANADGVSLAYQDGERKIREDVQKQFNLSGKGLNAFNVACDRDTAGHWGRLNQYEFNEGQKNKKLVTDNALIQISNEAQTLYNDVNSMNDALGKMRATIDANYFNMGKDYCDAYFRQSAANLVTSSLNVAIRKNDMAGADVIMNKFGYLVPPSQLSTYAKAVQEYTKQNNMIANAERLYEKYPNDPRGALKEIRESASLITKDIPYPKDGSVSDKAAALAVWVQNNIPNAKVPAAIIFGQWYQETAQDGTFGSSPLAKEDFNLGGLTQVKPNGIKQPDGGNYYRHYNSYPEFAESYIKHFIGLYDPPPGGVINTPEEYAHWLKQNGYYGAPEAEYAAGIRRGMEIFNKMYGQKVQTPMDNISIKDQEQAFWKVWNENKRIDAIEQEGALSQAKLLFSAAGPTADPHKIALQVAGDKTELAGIIENNLRAIQNQAYEKGIPDEIYFSVRDMIGRGEFNSLADALKYVQVPGQMANAKQQDQIKKWWEQHLNLDGYYSIKGLDGYIAEATVGIKDQEEKKTRTNQLKNYLDNAVNAFIAEKHRNPNPTEIRKLLAENVTTTTMEVTTSSGQPVTFNNLEMGDVHIVSVNEIGNGRVSVTYRDSMDNPYGPAKTVNMFVEQFAELIGKPVQNDWTGGSDDDTDTLNSGT